MSHWIPLTERQIKLMEVAGARVFTVKEILSLMHCSDDSVLRDIKYLISKGMMRKVNKTKGAKYFVMENTISDC